MGKFFGGSFKSTETFNSALSQWRVKYTDTWAKLQKKASGTGSTCDNPRFGDNGDGTVTDRLTALQWEKKTDDASIHNKDNLYTWSATPPYATANGTASTTFLIQLNHPLGCFAGQCDWRLPTIYELQTILSQPYRCTTRPCIDETVFGPTASNVYWSSTTNAAYPGYAWFVYFYNGVVN